MAIEKKYVKHSCEVMFVGISMLQNWAPLLKKDETNSNAPSLYAQSKGPNGWPMKTGVGCCNPRISNGASPTGSRWPTARVWRQELEISVSLRILFGPPAILSARAGAGAGDAERGGAAGGPSNLASPRSSSTPPCSSRLSSACHLRPKLESRATTFH